MALASGIFVNATIYGILLALMATGLTLTYITTKIPNFAHGNFVAVGAYLAYTLLRFDKVNPYYSIPITAIICGGVAVFVYQGLLRPLIRRGAAIITLMIVTLAINILFVGIFGIYGDILLNVYHFPDAGTFYLASQDFHLFGFPGIMIVGLASLVVVVVSIFMLLNLTKFGLAMKASVEIPGLAGIMGIKVNRVYAVSWLMGGALAGLAGSLVVLFIPVNSNFANSFIVSIFAASILGGLESIYGAVAGGLIIGSSQILVTSFLGSEIGSWVFAYQQAVPILIMVTILLIVPRGITSINLRRWKRFRRDR